MTPRPTLILIALSLWVVACSSGGSSDQVITASTPSSGYGSTTAAPPTSTAGRLAPTTADPGPGTTAAPVLLPNPGGPDASPIRCSDAALRFSTDPQRPPNEIWLVNVSAGPCQVPADAFLDASVVGFRSSDIAIPRIEDRDALTHIDSLATVSLIVTPTEDGPETRLSLVPNLGGDVNGNVLIDLPGSSFAWSGPFVRDTEPQVAQGLLLPSDSAGEPLTAVAVLSTGGLGPIHRGMTPQEVADRTATPVVIDYWEFGCGYASLGGVAGVALELGGPGDVEGAVVSGVVVFTPVFATPSGFRVGDAPDALFERFPDNLTEFPHEYTDGRYIRFEPSDPAEVGQNLWFEIEDGPESRIVSMVAATGFRIEGCL